MQSGAITSYLDVAQVTLYAFWLFFAGLVYYLVRENKREGYPLESERSNSVTVVGYPPPPAPKPLNMPHHGPTIVRKAERDLSRLLRPSASWQGAPLEPLGDAMKDGVGPASYAERQDQPDLTFDKQLPKIVPLRAAPGYYLAAEDPDPRGMDVVAADGVVAGKAVECWVDRSETLVRYLEVAVQSVVGERRVLVPMALVRINATRRIAMVASVMAVHFADAPGLSNPDQVTLLEEDRISGYFAGGHMYATEARLGPLL
jgi:photosynthetic reaction center H subunit